MMSKNEEVDVQKLWEKYEDIAMHFNDLLMRLRTQTLAGIAAVSALVGVFAKEGSTSANFHLDWAAAQAIFVAMIAFWIAVWCLDMIYYNRLLSGAVAAIIDLEKQTAAGASFNGEIAMSTIIDAQFKKPVLDLKKRRYMGVVAFYGIVFLVLIAGFLFAHARA